MLDKSVAFVAVAHLLPKLYSARRTPGQHKGGRLWGRDGQLFKLHGACHVRFCPDTLQADGSTKRVRKAVRLCDERDQNNIPFTKTKVKALAQEHMSAVNEQEESKKLPAEQKMDNDLKPQVTTPKAD